MKAYCKQILLSAPLNVLILQIIHIFLSLPMKHKPQLFLDPGIFLLIAQHFAQCQTSVWHVKSSLLTFREAVSWFFSLVSV